MQSLNDQTFIWEATEQCRESVLFLLWETWVYVETKGTKSDCNSGTSPRDCAKALQCNGPWGVGWKGALTMMVSREEAWRGGRAVVWYTWLYRKLQFGAWVYILYSRLCCWPVHLLDSTLIFRRRNQNNLFQHVRLSNAREPPEAKFRIPNSYFFGDCVLRLEITFGSW
jgi:hypothetical protein